VFTRPEQCVSLSLHQQCISWLYFRCGNWIHVKGMLGAAIVICYISDVFDYLDLLSLASKGIACGLKDGGNIFLCPQCTSCISSRLSRFY
jgi:hypothetical protein